MYESRNKVVVFCAIGGMIGFLIGSRLGSAWTAISLAMLSACMLYVSYKPRESIAGVRHAWRSTLFAFKSTREWNVQEMFRVFGWGQLVIIEIALFVGAIVYLLYGLSERAKYNVLGISILYGFMGFVLLEVIITSSAYNARFFGDGRYKNEGFSCRELKEFAYDLCPVVLVWLLLKVLWSLVRFTGTFLWKFISFIHSEERVLTASSVVFGAICGIAVRAATRQSHDMISFEYAVVVGALLGLVYGMAGSSILRRRLVGSERFVRSD